MGREEKTSHLHMSSRPWSPPLLCTPPTLPRLLSLWPGFKQICEVKDGDSFPAVTNDHKLNSLKDNKRRNVLSYSSGGQNPKSRCQQDHTPSKALGKDPSRPPPALGVSLLVTASIQRLPLSPHGLFPCVLIKSSSSCQEHQLLDSRPT